MCIDRHRCHYLNLYNFYKHINHHKHHNAYIPIISYKYAQDLWICVITYSTSCHYTPSPIHNHTYVDPSSRDIRITNVPWNCFDVFNLNTSTINVYFCSFWICVVQNIHINECIIFILLEVLENKYKVSMKLNS